MICSTSEVLILDVNQVNCHVEQILIGFGGSEGPIQARREFVLEQCTEFVVLKSLGSFRRMNQRSDCARSCVRLEKR
ncbi:MAG TPA: hypothetical protein DIT89_15735 [Planctomycetaceae bacterium]|nr:hypothetical protein [Planctomycetaceae bacterium]